jgi:hypothetical protein
MKAFRPKRTTRAKLALALEVAGAPAAMIARAVDGYYDDYLSPLPAPIVQLVDDCEAAGLPALAARARAGEWDGQRWEAEAWAQSPEGREVFRQLRGGTP